MLRIVSTLFLSGTLAFGGLSAASAQSERKGSTAPARTGGTRPLAAGPAAGIEQAQAQADVWNYVPFAVVGGLALLIVLATGDEDNDTVTATTGTN